MDLRQTIEFIRTLEKELALFNIDTADRIDDELSTFFETQNVRITVTQTTSKRPADIAVLSTQEKVLEIIDVETLRRLVTRPQSSASSVGLSDTEYEDILNHLKETTFTSYDTEQMLYASREIEDRARRCGEGTIHAGFQQCSRMGDQRTVYRDLAQNGLTVHAYGIPDVTPPDLADGRVHAVASDEIADTWFVVFDGGGEETQKSALLAEERADDVFYGAWTYDAAIVDRVCAYLEQTYP